MHIARFVDFICIGCHTQPLYICPEHLNFSAYAKMVHSVCLLCLQIIAFKQKNILTES